jgi:hypothetical protein
MESILAFSKTHKLLFFLILFSTCIWAQERKWPVQYGNRLNNSAPIWEGLIVLKNNDTLKGFIKLLLFTSAYPILDTGTNKVQDVNINDISLMRLYAHSPDGPFTDFINMNYHPILWRLLGRKNKIAIYDNALKSGIIKMILVNPNKRIWLYNGFTWFFNGGNMNHLLIRFINKRYKTSFKEKDFRATQDMIQYILDKEDI